MDGRQHLEAAISKHGGIAQAARAWQIPYPTLYAVTRGYRGVSRRQAGLWEAKAGGDLIADRLIWIRATRAKARTSDRAESGTHS
jgi:hypothetical protein